MPGTAAARFLQSLSESTTDDAIQAATTWTQQDDQLLSSQEDLARTSDSVKATQEIARLDRVKVRVNEVASALDRTHVSIVAITNETIQKVLEELKAAQLAYATAMAERKTPESLPGVGSANQWQILYAAAKKYSEDVAYPGEDFPKTDDALCVLCQQPLDDDAVERFGRFKKFMEDTTSKILTAKREELAGLRRKVELIDPLATSVLDSICDDLISIDDKLPDSLRAYNLAVATQKSTVLSLLNEGEDPRKAVSLPTSPAPVTEALRSAVKLITDKITGVTNASKPDEYKKLLASIAEMKSRKAFNVRRAEVVAYVVKARRNDLLRKAATSLNTYDITRQGTVVIKKNLTPELISAFKSELKDLGAWIPISLKPSGSSGETAHEVLLEGATLGRARISDILSEGEARVIAIAGFLAELQLVPHTNAIVLDDPVSSLDHVFTRKIAARLVREGLRRQVIIFTHNIAFLMELEDASRELGLAGTPVGIVVHSLRRSAQASGITTNGVPWYAMDVKGQVQYLEGLVKKITPLYQSNMTEYNKEAAYVYGLLRESWESCIEDDLLHSVVCRYRNSVHTLKLMKVDIEDGDVYKIDLNMSKASTWLTGHAKSKALHEDRPAPDELLADINALQDFSKQIIKRRDQTDARRKAKLKP